MNNIRKIVQICTISDPGPRRWGLCALADDGTVWVKTIDVTTTETSEGTWRQLADLPQENSP